MAQSNALTEQQWSEIQARVQQNMQPSSHPIPMPAMVPASPQTGGPRRVAGKQNKWEEAFGCDLEMQRRVGQIIWYKFEAMKLRLADNTTYLPDWMVVTSEGKLQAHEVKGFLRTTAAAKFKIAAELFPFIEFFMWRKNKVSEGGGWDLMRHLNGGENG